TWLYALPIALIVGFCFWKPNFPRVLAPKIGIRSERDVMIFLVIYWIAVPVIIHRLMAQIRIE
ncbi:MAG: hypothetical protein OXR03_03415, partial [Rhodospirillaceae bacterium]|nr:hypothetical protein [Rhodospirillaceae bacterium]